MEKNDKCITNKTKTLMKVGLLMLVLKILTICWKVIVISLMNIWLNIMYWILKLYKYYDLNLIKNQGLIKNDQKPHYDFPTSI